MHAGWRGFGLALMVAMTVALGACQGSVASGQPCPGDPDEEVMQLREEWTRAPYSGLHDDHDGQCGRNPQAIESKEMIRRKAENLLFRYPQHVPTRFFAALLAYEANDPTRATEHLDTLFALQPIHPEAAVLRARIALEAGNAQFATGLLEDQIALRPDNAELYETLSSAYFLQNRPTDAVSALATADSLGAPKWRTAYNRGLLAESQGNTDQAIAYFKDCLKLMPGWPPAQARLRGLERGSPGAQAVAFPPLNAR